MTDYKNKGLINKYNIQKADGSEINEHAEYFVLRLDEFQSDPIHRLACLKALIHYAELIEGHLPELSKDLLKKYLPQLREMREAIWRN